MTSYYFFFEQFYVNLFILNGMLLDTQTTPPKLNLEEYPFLLSLQVLFW